MFPRKNKKKHVVWLVNKYYFSLNNAMLMNTLDTINGSVAAPPRVDRSSKANAESLYSKANDAK